MPFWIRVIPEGDGNEHRHRQGQQTSRYTSNLAEVWSRQGYDMEPIAGSLSFGHSVYEIPDHRKLCLGPKVKGKLRENGGFRTVWCYQVTGASSSETGVDLLNGCSRGVRLK
ncbi:hypothetical protein RRG08_051619 [Elysia crispata]|uniref:Uncharacterized protein n=1 Tax=Elysia crispata TaxID=231223 RepID=A0AAE1A3S2_9GAST|nr:hypothetical protein RRG08_051619 [Elysia crispata]